MPRGRGRYGEPGCPRDGGGGGRGGGGGHGDGDRDGHGGGGGMRGLVEPAVLAALGSAPAHGYDLRASLEELTSGAVRIDPGGLYRVLRRMEDDGLVVSAWEAGDHGPQRRTYRLTADGRDVLRCWVDRLDARRRAIDGIVAAALAVDAPADDEVVGTATTTDPPAPRRRDDTHDDGTAHDDAR